MNLGWMWLLKGPFINSYFKDIIVHAFVCFLAFNLCEGNRQPSREFVFAKIRNFFMCSELANVCLMWASQWIFDFHLCFMFKLKTFCSKCFKFYFTRLPYWLCCNFRWAGMALAINRYNSNRDSACPYYFLLWMSKEESRTEAVSWFFLFTHINNVRKNLIFSFFKKCVYLACLLFNSFFLKSFILFEISF